MSGTLRSLGILSIAAVVPGLAQLKSLLDAAQALAKAELTAKLTGLLKVQAALTIPPPPTLTIAGAVKVAAQIALNPLIAAPSLQLTAVGSLIGEINLKLGGLLPIDLDLGAAGIAAYSYTGTIDSLGSSLGSATSGGLPGGTGADNGYAVIFVATSPAAIAALQANLAG